MAQYAFRGLGSLVCAILPLAAFAQKSVEPQIGPSRTLSGVSASPLNTDTLFLMVDESFHYQPRWPENPPLTIEEPARANKLIAGKLLSKPRGQLSGLFPAIDATGWTPPDPDIAVGPNHILAVANSSIAWFNKAGTKLFQQTASTFFSGMGAGTFIFDPKCFYDRVNGRYVLIFLEQATSPQTSKILLAVSDDNDPTGTWYRYRLEAMLNISGQNYWLDYPGFGYNKDAFVVCGNMFGFTSGFGGVQFMVIPSAPLLSGGAATVSSFRHAAGTTTQVAEMISNTATNIYAFSRSGSTSVRVYSVNSPTSSPTINFTSVAVPSNSAPSMDAASTNGRLLDTIDSRMYNATWRNGKLVGAHNLQSGSFVGSRWYDVNTNGYPSAAPTLAQSGNITSGSLHYFSPAISINSTGDISAVFSASSSTVTANLMYAGRNSGDAAGTMGAPQLLQSSAGNNYSQGRWGDYFGVDVDPVDDNTFWGIGMTVASNNAWRTSIYSWTIP